MRRKYASELLIDFLHRTNDEGVFTFSCAHDGREQEGDLVNASSQPLSSVSQPAWRCHCAQGRNADREEHAQLPMLK